VRPRKLSFAGRASLQELRLVCEADERHTEIISVGRPAQVLLHPDTGMTAAEGLRFNAPAFRQVCQVVGGNLNGVLAGIWSESKSPDALKRDTLLRVFNNILKLRFESLLKYQLVVDQAAGEIVGLVSRKYQRVPNVELLSEVVAAASGTYQVVQARVDNRDMFVLFSRSGSAVAAADGTWSQGLAVYNSETSKRAVHLPLAVFDSVTKSYCLEAETKSNRLIHRKSKGFHQTLDAVVQTAVRRDGVVGPLVSASSVGWRSGSVIHGVTKLQALQKIKRGLVSKGFSATVIERVAHLLGSADIPSITRRSLYISLLTVADESVSSSRLLRVFASTLLSKGP